MKTLPYSVDRNILIEADRETVFGFFTDSARWASWWGAGSTVEPRPGGALRIRHSNGFESVGEVLELVAPERFVFTFSLQGERPVPAEESRVTIRLEPQADSTMLRLTHEALLRPAFADTGDDGCDDVLVRKPVDRGAQDRAERGPDGDDDLLRRRAALRLPELDEDRPVAPGPAVRQRARIELVR